MSFFDELKRRHVIRVSTAYVVTAWLLIQVSETILPVFGFTDFALRVVIVVLAIGLALVHHSMGDEEASDAALKELMDLDDKFAHVTIPYVHAWRGEFELAFEALSRLEQNGHEMSGINLTPFFEPIRNDPRWEELLVRQGISKVQLDDIPFEIEFED